MHLFYTGNSKIDGRRRSLQCQAISEDGKTFQKVIPLSLHQKSLLNTIVIRRYGLTKMVTI